jgi:hypothetical protein
MRRRDDGCAFRLIVKSLIPFYRDHDFGSIVIISSGDHDRAGRGGVVVGR